MSKTQDTELFELCKEVSQRTKSGWGDIDYFYCSGNLTHRSQMDDDDFEGEVIPLYTSDYLLEKLPKGCSIFYSELQGAWEALAHTKMEDDRHYADTPLKALLKLVIALDNAGIKL